MDEQAEEAEPGDEVPPELKINSPIRPTRKEFEEHAVSHFPFRSWCEACVRGKAKANPHRKIDHTDETTPVVTVDYCFMNSRTDDVVWTRRLMHQFLLSEIDGRSIFLLMCCPTKV